MIWINAAQAIRDLESARQKLGPQKFAKAISRGMNEAIMQGRTVARQAVKEVYNIPQRYVGGINVVKSFPSTLRAKIYASTVPIPMDAFAPKFQNATTAISVSRRGEQRVKERKGKKKRAAAIGVSIEVIKGRRETVPYAFMIAGAKPRVFARGAYKGGNKYGFIQRHKRARKEGSDNPIKPLLSVTVHTAVINKQSMGKIEAKVNAVYPAALVRNVNLLLAELPSQ